MLKLPQNKLPQIMARLAPLSAFGVCLYAFSIPIGNSPPQLVLFALVIPAAALCLSHAELRTNRVLLAALVWIACVLIQAVLSQFTDLPGRHLRAANNFYFISLAPFVAIQIAIASRAVPLGGLAAVALYGAMISGTLVLAIGADWSAGIGLFTHFSVGLGSANRNYMAIIAGVTLFAAISLAAFHIRAGMTRGGLRVSLLAGPVLIAALAGVALVSMQSRASTIAAFIALVFLSTCVLAIFLRGRNRKTILTALLALLVIFGAIVIAILQSPIAERFAAGGGVMQTLRMYSAGLFGPQNDAAAVEARVHLFELARELIAQKPWFGWGTDPSSLIATHGRWDFTRTENLIHFHNAYLEIAVAIGLAGLTLLLALTGVLALDIARARRTKGKDDSPGTAVLLPFALTVLVFFAVIGLAESIHRVEFATQTTILVLAFLLSRGSIASAVETVLKEGDAGRSSGRTG